ncbi:MAG: carboxymuconolactone decarboxylase family protein [Acidobacteriota bacterium]
METNPTAAAQQVPAMMCARMGDTTPAWPKLVASVAPDLLTATGATSPASLGGEARTIPPRYRSLLAVAAALGRGQATCAGSQAHMARQAGASHEEILDTVRIARHLAAAGVVDASAPLLADLASGTSRFTERGR